MSIKKQFDKNKPVCKVTFNLANSNTNNALRVNLAGDFNNWNIESIPMKKISNSGFSVSVDLKKGREYQFKYLVDGSTWLNETEADKHVTNIFQSENSVVVV